MQQRIAKKKPAAKRKAATKKRRRPSDDFEKTLSKLDWPELEYLSAATLKRRYSRGGLMAKLQCAYLHRAGECSLNLEFASEDGQFFEADIPVDILLQLLSLAIQVDPDSDRFTLLLGQPVRKSWTQW